VRRTIAESMAIIELLEEQYPSPALLPADPFLRARARQLASLIVSGIQPLQNTAAPAGGGGTLAGHASAWGPHCVGRGLGPWESLVSETAGRFAVGDAVSVADVCLVPEVEFSKRFGVDLTPYPTLTRIAAACGELPAFQVAHSSRQPDAEIVSAAP